jgi:uncharacterized repeat protein (TIGR01451 family)
MSEPPSAFVGVPLTYQITLTNSGTAPAADVMLSASFDPALEHETKANPVELPLGTLGAGEVKNVPLILTPRRPGQFVTRVTATAASGVRAETSRTVTVQSARMTVTKAGPKVRYVDQNITWDITVVNNADAPLANVAIRDPLPSEVTFVNATGAGQLVNGQVVWNFGSVAPREQRTVQVTARCTTMSPRVMNTAIVTADPGLQEQAEAELEIRGVPAFKFDVSKPNGAVPIGGLTTYQVTVTNTGSLPANQVEIIATLPPEIVVTSTSGPSGQDSGRVDGNRVAFPPQDGLAPKQTFTYYVQGKAQRAGDVRFRAELRSTALSLPVVKEQPTTIYDPANGAQPPAVPK